MASYDYDIANLALTRLGATPITSLDDGSRNATVINGIYSMLRDEVLRAHPWKFATRRVTLGEHAANELTITDITAADPGVVTYTGTDPEDGDEYLIDDVIGMTEVNENIYVVSNVDSDSNTFELLDTDTTSYTAYDSAGTAVEQIPHTADFEYVYDLPSDCLRVFAINDNWDALFEIDPVGIMTNENPCEIIYCRQVTDVTKYDPTFVDAFAWRLAMESCIAITGSMKKAELAAKMFYATMAKAQLFDASEKQGGYPAFSRYKDARR
jgi:hypothetical protein